MSVALSFAALPSLHAGSFAQLQASFGSWEGARARAGHSVAMADAPVSPEVGGGKAVADDPDDLAQGVFESGGTMLMWQKRDTALASEQLRSRLKAKGTLQLGQILNEAKGGWVLTREMDGTPYYVFYDAADGKVRFISVDKIRLGDGPNASEVGQTRMEAKDGNLVVTYGSPQAGSVVQVRMSPDSRQLSTTLAIMGYNGGKFQEGLLSDASAVGTLLADRSAVPAELAAKLDAAPAGRASRGEADPIKNDKTWAQSIAAWMGGPNRSVLVSSNNQGRLIFKLREGDVDKVYVYATASAVKDFPVR